MGELLLAWRRTRERGEKADCGPDLCGDCASASRAAAAAGRGREPGARFVLVNFAQDSVLLISGSQRGEQECIVAFLKMV